MSSIKLSPNASGTGIFTIAAPNSNTDRTLTLPDQTGTVLTNAGPFTANASASAGAVTIDASNNVGIGTSSPGAKLQVTSASDDIFRLVATAPYLSFYNGAARTGYIRANSGNFSIVSEDASTAMTFYTAGNERARIDSSGTAMFNCTGQLIRGGETFRVNGGTGIASFYSNVNGPVIAIKNNYAVSTYQIAFNNNTQECGTITTGSNTVGYNSNSDYRLKENIQPMVGALAKVALLKPVTYQWKADGSDGQGFIAHELQEVVPEAVTGEKDGVDEDGNPRYQGVDTSFLVATLTAAIQEQQALIESLTARIAALEAQP